MLKYKRIYEESTIEDGYRILVDRLWARGVTKEKAKVDHWAKEIAPSTELRKKFHHQEENFEDFQREYIEELEKNSTAGDFLALVEAKLQAGDVTLLYAAKDEVMNNASVLKGWIAEKLSLSKEEVRHG